MVLNMTNGVIEELRHLLIRSEAQRLHLWMQINEGIEPG